MNKYLSPLRGAFLLLAIVASVVCARAQTYSLSPTPSLQFLASNGTPLAGGLVYSYAAGTLTPLPTYEDSMGLVSNTNPVTLDASGHPTNGSNPVGLWLTNNTAYKLCVNDSNNVPQYCIDQINNKVIGTFQDVVNLWQDVTSGCYLRGDGYCIVPPGGGNVSVAGTFTPNRIPIATGPTTLGNGPLLSSVLVNSPLGSGLNFLELNLSPWVGIFDLGPGTVGTVAWEVADCSSAANGGKLYKITSLGCATPATTSDTETHVYIAAGDNAGFAQLSVAGVGFCTFDNSEIPGDYVVNSTSTASECHDAGSSIPYSTFVIGTAVGAAGQVALQGSISSLGGGNVTTSGMTAGLIPMATNATDIENSHLQQVSGGTTGPDYVAIYDPTVTYGSGLFFLGANNVQGLMTGNLLVDSGTANHLVKVHAVGATGHWEAATTSDTNVLVVPLVSTLNSIGGALIEPQFSGMASIVDDGTACTPGDVVVASSTTAATIHDTGQTYPPAGVFPVGICAIGSSPDLVFLTLGGPGGVPNPLPVALGGTNTSSPTFATLTDGATVTWAVGSALIASADLTFTVHSGSRTLNLTGLVSGGIYTMWMKQDSTGGEGLLLGTGCTWKVAGGGGGAITPSTGANAVDVLTFQYDGTNCYATLTKNYT